MIGLALVCVLAPFSTDELDEEEELRLKIDMAFFVRLGETRGWRTSDVNLTYSIIMFDCFRL